MESPRSSEKYPQKITQILFFSFSEGGEGVSVAEDFICYLSNWQILKSIGKNVGKKKKRIALHSLLVEFKSYSLCLFVFLKGKSALWQYLLKVKMSMCFDSAITVLNILEE